ncbi:MAG: hypothetical protein WCJ13_09760 [Coriobacteriia bacterium]
MEASAPIQLARLPYAELMFPRIAICAHATPTLAEGLTGRRMAALPSQADVEPLVPREKGRRDA